METYKAIRGSYYEDLRTGGNKSQSWFYATRERYLLDFARLKPGLHVLDIGCGSGVVSREIARHGCKVVGIDVSADCIRYAKKKAREEGSQNARFLVGSIERLPFRPRTFDLIVASHVIEHVEHPRAIMEEMRSRLKPGGLLVVTTPNYKSLWPLAEFVFDRTIAEEGYSLHEQHITKFDPAKIRSLLRRNGFTGVRVEAPYMISLPFSLLSSRCASTAFYLEKPLARLPFGAILYAKGTNGGL